MDKVKKSFKVIFWVLCVIAVVFTVLYFVSWTPAVYFALGSLGLALMSLCVLQVSKYTELNDKIKAGYDVYLVESYERGEITKDQLDSKDKSRYKIYKKMYRGDKATILCGFILWFGLAVAVVSVILKQPF